MNRSIKRIMVLLGVGAAAFSVLLFASPLTGAQGVPECTMPPTGMVSWWPGDGKANDIQDSNHGTLQNGATFAAGKVGQAFSFDGSDDFVSVNSNANLTLSTFSYDFWLFNPGQICTARGRLCRVISRQFDGFEIAVTSPGSYLGFPANVLSIFHPDYAGDVWMNTDFIVPPNVWTHIAVTFDLAPGSIGTLKVYGNGTLAFTNSFTAKTIQHGLLHIGGRITEGGENYYGSVDEVEVFNRVLTPSEIEAIYNAGSAGKCKNRAPIALLSLNGSFDFGPLTPVRTPPAQPPSDTFTVENSGNASLVLTFASILRTGREVDGQKITMADDRNLYSLRAINPSGTETPIGIGATRTIGIGQRQSFRVLYNPVMPLVADRTSGLGASQVLQETNTSILTITTNDGPPLQVNLMGRINPTVQMISPVSFTRSGNDVVIAASAYDPNLNTYLMRFQFLDSAGRNIGLAHDVELREAIQKSTIVKGQSFTVEQRFPGAASNQSITSVRVTAYDSEGDSSAASAATEQTVNALATVSAASYSEAAIASETIASAFGTGLATMTIGAGGQPLPTSLGGTTVKVKDSMGTELLAALFYVSPTQVNYLIPADTKPGLAMITITSGDGKVAMGATNIAWVAPALFSANSDGQGVAAAAIQRVVGEQQSYEAVATFDQALNKFVAVPINLGSEAEQVYLILFGTGIRHTSSMTAIKAYIGGIEVPVTYAGAQGEYAGLDQVNLRLPRSLTGRGEVEVKLVGDMQITNTVKINIR